MDLSIVRHTALDHSYIRHSYFHNSFAHFPLDDATTFCHLRHSLFLKVVGMLLSQQRPKVLFTLYLLEQINKLEHNEDRSNLN